jgi:hypothetical protein
MKKYFPGLTSFLISILSLSGDVNAQGISPQSINSGGATMTQSNGSLSFTVGELVVLQLYDSLGNSLSSGFTNAATTATTITTIESPGPEVLDMTVYPNPTSDLVSIRIKSTKLEKLLISILDAQGKEVSHGLYAGVSNTIGINLHDYATGTYIMQVKSGDNQVIATYKVIKQ